MSESALIEQLDRAVDALLARRDAAPPAAAAELAPLLRLAAGLLDLPSGDFRARLKSELERRATMPAKSAKRARKETQSLTPYLVVERLDAFLEFLAEAFGAEVILRAPGSAGGTHCELRIGDSKLMAGGGPGISALPSAIHLYVPDADAAFRRALYAGATPFYEPTDQPYGDREAGVKDGFGNSWYIATHKATGHRPPGMATATPTLHPRGADALIDFMKRALGGEETLCERTPDGTVMHAAVRIGDSVVEVGEAHGPIEPTASMFLLDVDDVDACYRRALEAGGTSIEAPAKQRYGARRAAVKDPHGNQWYFSAPIRK